LVRLGRLTCAFDTGLTADVFWPRLCVQANERIQELEASVQHKDAVLSAYSDGSQAQAEDNMVEQLKKMSVQLQLKEAVVAASCEPSRPLTDPLRVHARRPATPASSSPPYLLPVVALSPAHACVGESCGAPRKRIADSGLFAEAPETCMSRAHLGGQTVCAFWRWRRRCF